ncbi:unconventional myosin-Vb isoform X3 [Chironomus tepperi]|uniref:unconventional myosin-Vb isoform X3 n=1 Tax=Chironomus tepperi TaxID=113505 RepID=UPI00391FBBA6
MASNIGLSKVFILDKYFKELQKFWQTEKMLQDASSSNEAVHLQQRLKSLSTELVTLRNRLHVTGSTTTNGNANNPIINCTNFPHPNLNLLTGKNMQGTTATTTTTTTATLQHNINISNMNNSNAICTNNNNNNNSSTNNNNNNNNTTTTNNNNNTTNNNSTTNNSMKGSIPLNNNIHSRRLNNQQYNNNNADHVVTTRNISIPLPLPKNHEEQTQLINTPHSPVKEEIRNNCPSNTFKSGNPNMKISEMEDLIYLTGPLTEDAVMKSLQARFNEKKFFTNIGPILLSINPYHDVGNPLTLSSTRSIPMAPQLVRIVQEAVRQQTETGYPQAIILSGTSGSGKTHCSMLLLRQLFAVAGGGPETDAFKHLAAAFTVLRSLGSAATATNSESSRIGQFIEVQVTDGALYRTKIHCYFLDQTRVIRPLPNEKNYHIFYQMLSGLSDEERTRLCLTDYQAKDLNYLQIGDTRQDEQEDAARFQAWKACLGILGIPFLDVVRVLAAVLLLGNVKFVDNQRSEVETNNESELNSVANLLGVSSQSLFRGLTTRTHNTRGQLIKSVCDANMSNIARDSLAKALYCRTVATIVRRANSLKRLGSGTLSSDSNESVHNQAEVNSQHASTIGGHSAKSMNQMAVLNNVVRHATDGFIGILDMFGFEEPKLAQLEHLCINLCAETMQHFYNTHIFKSSVESCRDEGIICDSEIDYVDNVPCIDLISSLRTGLLSLLDSECSIRGTAESYVAKIKVQHRNSPRLEQRHIDLDSRMFIIRHFYGQVIYDASDFLDTNRDIISDDLVSVFYKHNCQFGFATHLFGAELRALYSHENVPRGTWFRIAPTSHTDLLNGDEPVSTLTQDFHTRLDNLLRTLVMSRPHFVRCIRSNSNELPNFFERNTAVRQIRALQILETVNLMASGFPHRMRFKQFISRYKMLVSSRLLRRCEEKAIEDCKLLLNCAMEHPFELDVSVVLSWAPGKRHIFLSEGMRQHLENLRNHIRNRSAILIQSVWRGWQLRRLNTMKRMKKDLLMSSNTMMSNSTISRAQINPSIRPRPQPITGTPDLESPPMVPPPRPYTVSGNSKLKYPQLRIMKMNFPENMQASNGEQLKKGEVVTVKGASQRRGHLLVESNGVILNVPFQFLELVKSHTSPAHIKSQQVNV